MVASIAQALADALQEAESTRQQAVDDTTAIKNAAVQETNTLKGQAESAATTATEKAGEAASSAQAALDYRNQAQQAVADGVIADDQTGGLTTWSSQKISAELGDIGAILDEINGEVA